MLSVNAPPRVREPAGVPQNPVGERRRAPRHPASPQDILGPNEPVPGVTRLHLPVLAPPRDSPRWDGDVFISVDEVTPRKVGPACYVDPGGLHDALRRRDSVRDNQAT